MQYIKSNNMKSLPYNYKYMHIYILTYTSPDHLMYVTIYELDSFLSICTCMYLVRGADMIAANDARAWVALHLSVSFLRGERERDRETLHAVVGSR